MDGGDIKVRRVDWYFDEWLAGTARLDATERGVYVTICSLIYSNGGPIQSEGLAKLCGCHGTSFKRVMQRLLHLGKILVAGDEIDVKRCRNELEKARIRVENAQENGRKRVGKPSENERKPSGKRSETEWKTSPVSNEINGLENRLGYFSGRLTGASFNHQPPTTNLNLESPNGLSRASVAKSARRGLESEFEEIWRLFPRKRDRGHALKAFIAARKFTALDVIEAGLKQFARDSESKDPQFIAYPATWLNGHCWLDEKDHPIDPRNGHNFSFYDGPTEPPPPLETG